MFYLRIFSVIFSAKTKLSISELQESFVLFCGVVFLMNLLFSSKCLYSRSVMIKMVNLQIQVLSEVSLPAVQSFPLLFFFYCCTITPGCHLGPFHFALSLIV